ncbi:hypothetical protein [Insolitispirillum peregrinum]|uniref:Uncharacterized protein n=1 Tax=Insolitispirillum peregrinum TaxID=80876 RepID=A0A1N7MQ23_9PROT|nr:hypothetical protein [Insolitispirillum peregrinum]SIS88152.1 hypothetical protein SAMN05421779_104268 [Insolitispirillum peregrinum]
MTFPHHPPRPLEETRQQVTRAVTDLSCQIAHNTLSQTIDAVRNARTAPPAPETILHLAALSASARHVGQHVETIRWTTEQICARPALPQGRVHARAASVASLIHIFASISDVLKPFATISEARG